VILVDHFERHQALEGLDEAEILEIVDHHRVGALETRQPIRVDCRPLGSTATIIALKWQEAGVPLPRAEAILLLGGVLADTLLLTSPTTTAIDRKTASRLARRAGLALEPFGRELLARNDEIMTGRVEALLERDLKEFAEGKTRFAVAQVETVDRTRVTPERLAAFQEALRARRERGGWDFLALLITDTLLGDSIVLIDDPDSRRLERLSRGRGAVSVWPECVSRKKQFLPGLLEALAPARPD
jgi:manganese-dependent inorganic pyrophosphatase